MKALFPAIAALFLGLPALRGQDAPPPPVDAKTLLQQGLFAEEAEQQLDKAAASYEQIIAEFDRQRDFAVAALYRLAEVRRKQERNGDAATLFQRILAEFPEADPQARLSRENLTAMGIAIAPTGRAVPDDPEETSELRRLMMLAEVRPDHVWSGSPLREASRNGWLRVTNWLLNYAGERDQVIKDYPLEAAAQAGRLDICEVLMAHGGTIEAAGSALVSAIAKNDDAVAEWLIAKGVDLNACGPAHFDADLSGMKRRAGEEGRRFPAPENPRANCELSPLATAS
jgi:hypothetical protein